MPNPFPFPFLGSWMSGQLTKQSSDWGSCQWCLHPVLSQTWVSRPPARTSPSATRRGKNVKSHNTRWVTSCILSDADFGPFHQGWNEINCGWTFPTTKKELFVFTVFSWLHQRFLSSLRMWSFADEFERSRWFVGKEKDLRMFYNSSFSRIALSLFFFEMLDNGTGYNSQAWSLKRWNYSAATTETTHACREPPGTFLARDGGGMVSNYFSGNIK